jgi:hypothetical protein
MDRPSPPKLNIVIKPPSAPLLIQESPIVFTEETLRSTIVSRINYFVGKNEEALEKSLAHGLIYGKAQWWMHALEEMIDALAYIDAARRVSGGVRVIDADTHACIMHNLATCCHHLGHFEAANAYYDLAQKMMLEAPPSHTLFQCFPMLDPRPKQLAFMEARAKECLRRKMPDAREYFGGDGETRRWTPHEIAAAVVQAKELEGEERMSPALKLRSAQNPKTYVVGSTPRQQLW